MKLFLETSLRDLMILLLDENYQVKDKYIEENLIKKADALPLEVEKILLKNDLSIKSVDSFYITMGPGSFMGARTSLVYARTICQILNVPLYTISTVDLLEKKNEKVFIDAKGKKSYTKINGKLTLVDFCPSTILDKKDLEKNFIDYKNLFKQEKDLLSIEPYYVKDPQIGGK